MLPLCFIIVVIVVIFARKAYHRQEDFTQQYYDYPLIISTGFWFFIGAIIVYALCEVVVVMVPEFKPELLQELRGSTRMIAQRFMILIVMVFSYAALRHLVNNARQKNHNESQIRKLARDGLHIAFWIDLALILYIGRMGNS